MNPKELKRWRTAVKRAMRRYRTDEMAMEGDCLLDISGLRTSEERRVDEASRNMPQASPPETVADVLREAQ